MALDSRQPRPNFLVVVLDCVRASDFPGGREAVAGMRWTESLLEQSFRFPRAVSVAPWTIPAHASLFTGLYPWEHGCHARGSLTLAPDVVRLPDRLRQEGYATMSLAANPFINSTFGLTNGFERAGWGGWWESYARLPRSEPPAELTSNGAGPTSFLQRIRKGPLGEAMLNRMDDAYRFPFVLDGLNHVLQGIRAPNQVGEVGVSPWIEPTLERWVKETPEEQPIFACINLVDAHEPYYADPEVIRSTRDWFRYARARQDHVSYAAGEWRMTPERSELLHALYRRSIQRVDRRLRRMAEILDRAGRWDSTAMVLTSDHGQAFGEHDVLFHMFRPDDPELRIPLIYRPANRVAGQEAAGWASLIDVAPTLLAAAGAEPLAPWSGVPLPSLIESPRPAPVLSMSDGLIFGHVRTRFSPDRRSSFDRVWGVAYQGDRKAIVEPSGSEVRVYDVSRDLAERSNLWTGPSTPADPLETAAREVANRMVAAVQRPPTEEVAERLRSWGY
jgi:arylsulfatase A-like enzyme